MKASVKVMRSYDYCHFEVALGSDEDMTIDQINELRKQAALLVDEAVRQYQIAKNAEGKRERKQWEIENNLQQIERIKEKPRNEWSMTEAAIMRSYEDGKFWEEYQSEDYFYEDDSERKHHFSMLRKFQDTQIKAG